MYELDFDVRSSGGPLGFVPQVHGWRGVPGIPYHPADIDPKQPGILPLDPRSKLSTILMHPFGPDGLLIDSGFYEFLRRRLSVSWAGGTVPVRRSNGATVNYEWREVNFAHAEQVLNAQKSLLTLIRRSYQIVSGIETSFAHLSEDEVEFLPVPFHFRDYARPVGWPGQSSYRVIEFKAGMTPPPIFSLIGGDFCTDEFYDLYHEFGATGYKFRKLDPGELALAEDPPYRLTGLDKVL